MKDHAISVATGEGVVVVPLEKKVSTSFFTTLLKAIKLVDWKSTGYCNIEIKRAIANDAKLHNYNRTEFVCLTGGSTAYILIIPLLLILLNI